MTLIGKKKSFITLLYNIVFGQNSAIKVIVSCGRKGLVKRTQGTLRLKWILRKDTADQLYYEM